MRTIQTPNGPAAPSKIVCVGRNYAAHIDELGNEIPSEMVLFNKPNSAIGNTLTASVDGERLHYEGEICFLIQGGQYAAVAFGLDLTRRKLQSLLKAKGLPWERAKAFDGAAVFSEFVALPDQPGELSIELAINGDRVQRGGTGTMLYSPDAILAEIQRCMTLEDGDIVMTGTPSGVGVVEVGACFEGQVLARGVPLARGTWIACAGPGLE